MKRLADILLALLITPFAVILVLIACAVIWAQDRKNPVFAQTRLGLNQKPFTLYKLRTMFVGTPSVTSHNLTESNVTGVGTALRKYKLDELPQLINVLAGHMSFVGPRPGLPNDAALIAAREKLGVFAVRPGITGRSQILEIDMSTPEKLAESDARYIAEQSFAGDFKILVQTATGSGRGDRISKS